MFSYLGAEALHLSVACLWKTRLCFECFPYVCPEPVLVKRSFLYMNGSLSRACLGKKIVFIYKWHGKKKKYIYTCVFRTIADMEPCSRTIRNAATWCACRQHNRTTTQNKTSVQIIQTFAPSLSWQMNRRRYFGSKGNVQRSALRFGDISRVNDGFETRRGSNFRPFSFGSSRFNVQMSAQKAATTQFESQRRDIYIPRSR